MQVSLDHNDPKMPQTLQTYLDKELIKNAKRSGTSMERKYTSLSEGRYRDFYGLVSWLKNRYYPHYTHSRRRYGNGMRYETKGSSKGKGNRVDRELSEYIVDQTVKGKKQRKRAGKRKRTVDPLTDGVLKFWKAKGHTLVATQVPVYLERISRMTEADAITTDPHGDLYMWEIKTSGVGIKKAKGEMQPPYKEVPCTPPNLWELQRHYTHQGLVHGGLPLKGSRVLHVTNKRDGNVSVRALPNAKWLQDVELDKE